MPLTPRRLFAPLLVGAVLVAGCGVPRSTPPPGLLADDSTVPNLRRGQEALRDRIALEKEHVEALNLQLSGLRGDEERLYATYLAAEADYQLRAQDLAGVENDIAGVRHQLEDTRAQLAASRIDLAQLQADLTATGIEVVSLRQQLDAAHALRDVLATQLGGESAAGAVTESPKPPASEPDPAAEAPQPPTEEPTPAAEEPAPAAEEPAPAVAEPEPPATPGSVGSGGGGGSNA